MTDISPEEIRNRYLVLTWAVGLVAALVVATLGSIITISYQLGQIAGALNILVGHVVLK